MERERQGDRNEERAPHVQGAGRQYRGDDGEGGSRPQETSIVHDRAVLHASCHGSPSLYDGCDCLFPRSSARFPSAHDGLGRRISRVRGERYMPQPDATVFVVDDDASVREALGGLVRSAGLSVATYATAQEFLASPRAEGPSCLVLDVQLPGVSGLDLQRRMAEV